MTDEHDGTRESTVAPMKPLADDDTAKRRGAQMFRRTTNET